MKGRGGDVVVIHLHRSICGWNRILFFMSACSLLSSGYWGKNGRRDLGVPYFIKPFYVFIMPCFTPCVKSVLHFLVFLVSISSASFCKIACSVARTDCYRPTYIRIDLKFFQQHQKISRLLYHINLSRNFCDWRPQGKLEIVVTNVSFRHLDVKRSITILLA